MLHQTAPWSDRKDQTIQDAPHIHAGHWHGWFPQCLGFPSAQSAPIRHHLAAFDRGKAHTILVPICYDLSA